MRAPYIPPFSARRALAAISLALSVALVFAGCGSRREAVAVGREQLFTMSYGKAEDQMDLFQTDSSTAPLKTRLAMREGIFYVANGSGAKVVRLSSFGDVLAMIYNPDRNPEPVLLRPQGEGAGLAGRRAVQYPFRAVGEIAVDSRQTVYVEDRLPPERRVYDKELDTMLDFVVLRFDKDGQSMDYLGQEGLGGTPFPFIQNVYATAGDDCVVVALTQSCWLVDWFDGRGFVRHSLKIKRDSLPLPEGQKDLITSLDHIAPDSNGRSLIVKIDYYRQSVDPTTKSDTGVEFAGSWAYRMDPSTGAISDRWEIPAIEQVEKGDNGAAQRSVLIPEFLGMSGSRLFFITASGTDKSEVSVFDTTTHSVGRYSIDISQDEMYYSTLYLSPDGILCALLGTKYEARFVWWRFDKLLAGLNKEGGP
jgi:hypothetical protein